MLFFAQRVPGSGFFQANKCTNITGSNFIDIFALVRKHMKESTNPFFPSRNRVVNIGTRRQLTGINPDVSQFSNVWIDRLPQS